MAIFYNLKEAMKGGRAFFYFSLIFTALFFVFCLFEPWRSFCLHDGGQAPQNESVYLAAVGLLLIIFIFYFLFFRKRLAGNYRWAFLIFFALSFSLSLLWPLTSADLFSYISQGRVWSIYGLNPYLYAYSSLPGDYFFSFLNNFWSFRTAPYGPVFMLVSGFFAWLSQFSLWWSLFGLKLFFAGLNIAVGYLIYRFRKDFFSFYLYAFNPLVLLEIIINGHNDILFVLFLVSAIFLAVRDKSKRIFWPCLFLALSILTKYLSLLLLPIWLIIFWRENQVGRERWRMILKVVAAFTCSALFYLPFLFNWQTIISPLAGQARLVGFFVSPLIIIITPLFKTFFLNYLGISITVSRGLFLIFYVWLLYRVWQKGNRGNLLYYSALAFGAFLLSAFTWLMPWYFIALIAMLSLLYSQPEYRRLAAISLLIFTFYGIIYYFILR